MDSFQDAKNLIKNSENISIILSDEREESITGALALFYTLKELGKNVNLEVGEIPERLKFLIPSLNYITHPKNFVISIPNPNAEISEVSYEKNEKDLKIYLTINKGNIRKNDISFCFSSPKTDLFIIIGPGEIKQQESSLSEFPAIPIINIDNQENNQNFGKINLVKTNASLSEIIFELIKTINENLLRENVASALLTGLIISSDNFRSRNISPETLEIAAFLIKKGATRQEINDELFKQSPSQNKFLGHILSTAREEQNNKISWAVLDNQEFNDFDKGSIESVIEQLKTNFNFNNLLVLWKSHASGPVSKGVFYSENSDLTKKISELYQKNIKNNKVFFSDENTDLYFVKDKIMKVINHKA